MNHRWGIVRWAAAWAVLIGLSAPAWAARPFSTDDAGVIAKGQCEVQSFYEHLNQPGPNTKSLSGRLGCGVIGSTQLAFAYEQSKTSGQKTREMVLSGKTQLVDGGANRASFALAYSTARQRVPGGSWGSGDTAVNLVASVPEGPWVAHFNLGVTAERRPNRDVTTWALAFERLGLGLRADVDAGLEFYGNDRGSAWTQLAARWNFKPNTLMFDASLGREIGGDDITRLTLGFKLAF